jgi:cell division protein FtsB
MSSSRRTYVAYGAILCFVAALLFIWLSLGRNGLVDLYKMQKEREKHESILRDLKDNNRLLATEIRRLTQDPKYFESVARREMGLVKENEIIYRIKGGGKDK